MCKQVWNIKQLNKHCPSSSQVLLLGDKQKFVSCFLTLAVEVVKITIKYQ